MVKVVFRTEASTAIGTGHVMRCLTLAKALREKGANCSFIGREHPGDLFGLLEEEGFITYRLPVHFPSVEPNAIFNGGHTNYASWLGASSKQDEEDCLAILKNNKVDWIVVDHYALDAKWEKVIKAHVGKIMVIDDLANRPHYCDLLLDQNLGSMAGDYSGKVPSECKVLAGPKYALLRKEFSIYRKNSLARRQAPSLAHIIINLGGVDANNITRIILEVLAKVVLPRTSRITVIMGAKAPWLEDVKALSVVMPYQTDVLSGISNMAEIMASADLAIGAAGSASWERCCLGLPSISVVLAENQKPVLDALSRIGGVCALSLSEIERELPALIEQLKEQPGLLKEMSQVAANITDGKGVDRVLEWLL